MLEDQHYNIIERPTSRFTQVPNELINDNGFHQNGIDGFRALSLVLRIFSKPPTYRFYRLSLAEELEFSTSQLDRAIKVAKELGWLDILPVEYIKNDHGRIIGSRNIWKVTIPAKYTGLSDTDKGVSPEADKGVSPEVAKLSNTKTINTKDSNTNNTPSGEVLNSVKEKDEVEQSKGLIFKLARESGLEEPTASEAIVAGMILRDEITHYLGKKAIPTFIQGLVEAREKIEQGSDPDYLTVDIIADELRVKLLKASL